MPDFENTEFSKVSPDNSAENNEREQFPTPFNVDHEDWELFCKKYPEETHPDYIPLMYELFDLRRTIPVDLLDADVADKYELYTCDGVLNTAVDFKDYGIDGVRTMIGAMRKADEERKRLVAELQVVISENRELILAYERMCAWNERLVPIEETSDHEIGWFLYSGSLRRVPEKSYVFRLKKALDEFAQIDSDAVAEFVIEEERRNLNKVKKQERSRIKSLRKELSDKSEVTVLLAERLGYELPKRRENFFKGATPKQLQAVSAEYDRFVEKARELGSDPERLWESAEIESIIEMVD